MYVSLERSKNRKWDKSTLDTKRAKLKQEFSSRRTTRKRGGEEDGRKAERQAERKEERLEGKPKKTERQKNGVGTGLKTSRVN